jgi:proline dehydrogenase
MKLTSSTTIRATRNTLKRNFSSLITVLQQQQQNDKSLNFDDTRTVFSKLSTQQLVESYLTLTSCQIPFVRKFGPNFLEFGGNAATLAAKYTYFQHFCGGESLDDNETVVQKLYNLKVQSILDYSVEGSVDDNENHLNNEKEQEITQVIIDSVSFMRRQNDKLLGLDSTTVNTGSLPLPFAVVKFTGITDVKMLQKLSELVTYCQLYPEQAKNLLQVPLQIDNALLKYITSDKNVRTPSFQFNNTGNTIPSGLTDAQIQKFNQVLERMDRICTECHKHNIGLLIDAEQTWVQPAIDLLAMIISIKYNVNTASGNRPLVHNTYQLYLKDSYTRLQMDQQYLWNEYSAKHGVKLVRGAYMNSESIRTKQLNLQYPFNPSLQDTHKQYHLGLDFTLQGIQKDQMAAVIASHNVDTLIYANKQIQHYGLQKNDSRIMFAQLYGMGDSLTLTMANSGYHIAKYVPFGPVNEVLPYLARRLSENGDIMGGNTVETKRLKREICNRVFKKN